jgi:hypothetical protein
MIDFSDTWYSSRPEQNTGGNSLWSGIKACTMNEDSSEKCKGYLAITLNDLTPGLKVFFDKFSESLQFDTNFLCLIN